MADLDIKKMPASLEAEQAILGNIIIDPTLYDEVSFLSSNDFYLEAHQQIFDVMSDMFQNAKNIDAVTLINSLSESGKYTQGDAAKYIKTLAESASDCTNIAAYAKIVQDKAILRRLINASKEISENAFNEVGEVSSILDKAASSIYEISDNKRSKEFVSIKDAILSNYETLNYLQSNPNASFGINTNFEGLDRVLVGLGAGDLVIVGARPGMGKTSFCMNVACNVAKSTRKEVAIFSLEMTVEQLSSRLLCSEALINSKTMRTGKLNADEWKRLADASSALSQTNILINDSSDITVSEMKSKLRKLKNLGLIVVDYLQLMHDSKYSDNRVLEVAQITRSLKIMAKEFNVPIILCSQLSRGSSKDKEQKKPSLTDLRDSGAIEQDADIVLFLYREDYFKVGEKDAEALSDHETCDLIIAKNRHGSTGSIKLEWYGRHFRFVTSDERSYEEA